MRTLLQVVCTLCTVVALQAQDFLSLNDAVAQALLHNYDIRITRNQSELSQIQNTWANTSAYPTVAAGINSSYSNLSINQELVTGQVITGSGVTQQSNQAFVTLSWRAFDGMRMFATKSRLEELQKAGELQLKQQITQTIFDVCMAYYAIARLQQQRKATTQLVEVLNERLRIAEARTNIGVAAKNDVLQARIDANEQQSALLQVQNSIAQLTSSLNVLLGRAAQTKTEISDSIPIGAAPDFLTLQQQIDANNFASLLAQQEIAVALHQRNEIYAQGLPSVTFNTGYIYNYNQNSRGQILLNSNNGFNFGVGISIPLFNGLQTQTQLAAHDALIQQRRLSHDALKQQLELLYTNAYNNYATAKEIILLEQRNIELAEQNSRIAMERFKRQTITSAELRTTQYSTIESATRLFNAQFTAKSAELQLQLLAGTLYKE